MTRCSVLDNLPALIEDGADKYQNILGHDVWENLVLLSRMDCIQREALLAWMAGNDPELFRDAAQKILERYPVNGMGQTTEKAAEPGPVE